MNPKALRLYVEVEGETEEDFVKELLAPHLYERGYCLVEARLMGKAQLRSKRGGVKAWTSVRDEIIRHLRQDAQCLITTMVDYYALPAHKARAWPGRVTATQAASAQRAAHIEQALLRDVAEVMGASFDPRRFIPFIIHEFEGLLFSDCDRFAAGIARPELADSFQAIRDSFESPEDINDSPTTAPSKRVEALVPGYNKPLLGNLAALEIGLDRIRAACPHFRSWLEHLEALPELLAGGP